MSKPIYVLSGPNLNLLGVREPEIYGRQTLEDVRALCEARASTLGRTIVFRQSNHEGELIDWIQEAREAACAVVINPAGYGHTSVAILDALKAVGVREFASHLAGETTLDAAIAAARQATRNYAKRQLTWFRNQTPDWPRVSGAGG